jgi:hypothetical protein
MRLCRDDDLELQLIAGSDAENTRNIPRKFLHSKSSRLRRKVTPSDNAWGAETLCSHSTNLNSWLDKSGCSPTLPALRLFDLSLPYYIVHMQRQHELECTRTWRRHGQQAPFLSAFTPSSTLSAPMSNEVKAGSFNLLALDDG